MIKKILTSPAECIDSSFDNIEHNLVLSKGDMLAKNENNKYMVISMLGTGTFGQVVRCVSTNGDELAIKVVKSLPKYYFCEMNEVKVLQKLLSKRLSKYFVEIKDVFVYKDHLCIVEELLGRNLYELLKITSFRGFDHIVLRRISKQILEGLNQLSLLGITHCDLKPENILIKNYDTFEIKIIDFGSSFSSPQQSNFYVQSRYYRAPEVILGIPYDTSCDIWSFGCIIFEMFLGYPLFPGKNNIEQIGMIYNFFGCLPTFMLEHGKNTHLYFEKENNYQLIKIIKGITIQSLRDKVRSKDSFLVENEKFISFILASLNPSSLARPPAMQLINHSYLGEQSVIVEKIKEVRNQPNPIPRTMKHRRNSEFNICPIKKSRNNSDLRKRSVFDINDENKDNN